MKRLRLFVRIASVFILDYYFFESESGVDGVRHSLLTPHYRFPSAIFRFQRPDRPFDAQAIAERDRSEIENLEKGGPIAIADYYVDNSGTIEEFHEAFGKLMKDIKFID